MGATFSTPCVRVRRVCCYPTPRQLTHDWSEVIPVAVWIGQLGMWAEKKRETALSPSSLLSPKYATETRWRARGNNTRLQVDWFGGRDNSEKLCVREKLSSHTKQNLSEKCCFRANLKWSLIILVNLVIIPVIKMISNAWDLTNKKCKQNESI